MTTETDQPHTLHVGFDRRLRWEFDAADNVVKEFTGESESGLLRALPSETRHQYDALNRRTERLEGYGATRPGTNESITRRTAWAYDGAGNMVLSTDALGRLTRTEYDRLGQIVALFEDWRDGNADEGHYGRLTTMTYDALGNLVGRTTGLSTDYAPLVARTRHEYDGLGRQTDIFEAINRPNEARHSRTAYDAQGNVRFQERGLAEGRPTDQHVVRADFSYDRLNRPTRRVDVLHVPFTVSNVRLTRTMYDAFGNVLAEEFPAGGTWFSLEPSDPLYPSTVVRNTYVYDALGRRVRQTRPRGIYLAEPVPNKWELREESSSIPAATIYDAADNPVVTKALEGVPDEEKWQRYNAFHQVVEQTDRRNWSTATLTRYDAAGHVVIVTDPAGNETDFTFDALGQLVTRRDANRSATNLWYDTAGRLRKVIDRNGRIRELSYDRLDRPTGEYRVVPIPTPTGTVPLLVGVLTYTHDVAGNRTTAESSALGAPALGYAFEFTAFNQVRRVAEPFGLLLDSHYDAAGNRTRVDYASAPQYHVNGVDPFAGRVMSEYDRSNRLTERSLWTGAGDGDRRFVATQDWFALDRLHRLELGKGDGPRVHSTWRYDDAGRLIALESGYSPQVPGSTVWSSVAKFGYDTGGRLIREESRVVSPLDKPNPTRKPVQQRYSYGYSDQLEGQGGGPTLTYDAPATALGRTSPSVPATDCVGTRTGITTTTAKAT